MKYRILEDNRIIESDIPGPEWQGVWETWLYISDDILRLQRSTDGTQWDTIITALGRQD